MVRYSCSRCSTEIGSIPFESAREIISRMNEWGEKEKQSFLSVDRDGSLHIKCICEHCEQSLKQFPERYLLQSWLQ